MFGKYIRWMENRGYVRCRPVLEVLHNHRFVVWWSVHPDVLTEGSIEVEGVFNVCDVVLLSPVPNVLLVPGTLDVVADAGC